MKTLLLREYIRYKNKGFYSIIALLLLIAHIYFPYILAKKYWAYFVDANYRKEVKIFITMSILHSGGFSVLWAFFYHISRSKYKFLEKYRIEPNEKWPWEINEKGWHEQRYNVLKMTIFQHFVLVPGLLSLSLAKGTKVKMENDSIPSMLRFEFCMQMFFMMLIDDTFFYWSHRVLHFKLFYKPIHAFHHYYETYYGLGTYTHPVEYVAANIVLICFNKVSASSGLLILGSRVHFFTQVLWSWMRIWSTIEVHTGYDFPWSPMRIIPFTGSAKFHNYHHTDNDGNYGSMFTLWDYIMNTDQNYNKKLFKKEEVKIE